MLSERIRVACDACGGSGQKWIILQTHRENAGPCRSCNGTGRDTIAERQLGKLAEALSAHVHNGLLDCISPETNTKQYLAALTALLLGTEGER